MNSIVTTQGSEHLDALPRHFRYARASEASTLLINEPLAAAPRILRIDQTGLTDSNS